MADHLNYRIKKLNSGLNVYNIINLPIIRLEILLYTAYMKS